MLLSGFLLGGGVPGLRLLELLIVEINGLVDNPPGLLNALEVLHDNLLLLQLLIILEESMDLIDEMLRDVLHLADVLQRDVILGDGDDLIVLLTLIEHVHHSDDASLN